MVRSLYGETPLVGVPHGILADEGFFGVPRHIIVEWLAGEVVHHLSCATTVWRFRIEPPGQEDVRLQRFVSMYLIQILR